MPGASADGERATAAHSYVARTRRRKLAPELVPLTMRMKANAPMHFAAVLLDVSVKLAFGFPLRFLCSL